MKATKVIGCAGAVLLLAGCIENYVSVEVLGARPYEIEIIEVEDQLFYTCVTPDPGQPCRVSQGWIDFANGFYTFVQPFELRNNMPRTDTDVGRLDTATVTFDRMIVTYSGLPGQEQHDAALRELGETLVYGTYVIESNGGVLVAPLTLIPGFRGRAIQSSIVPTPGDTATIIASFRLEGELHSGASISTGTIDFPITVGFDSSICDDGRCDCYRQPD